MNLYISSAKNGTILTILGRENEATILIHPIRK